MTPSVEEAFLRRAIELAVQNVDAGDQPFGAVVAVQGRVVGEGVNGVVRNGDPTDHAEAAAIREACRRLVVVELPAATLYSSAQPCPMCQGAALLVGIRRTVYAVDGRVVARHGFPLPEVGVAGQDALGATPGVQIARVDVPGAEEPFKEWTDRQARIGPAAKG